MSDKPTGQVEYSLMDETHDLYAVDVPFQIGPFSIVAKYADDFEIPYQAEEGKAPPVVAILGEDVMRSLNAIVSLPENALLLASPEANDDISLPAWEGFSDWEPYEIHPIAFDCPKCFFPFCQRKRPMVEVSINGQTVKALLDTGSPTTQINLNALQSLGIENVRQARGKDTADTNGSSHTPWHVELKEFMVGNISISNVHPAITRFSGSTEDIACILGVDSLRAMNAYISYYDKSLYMKHSQAGEL